VRLVAPCCALLRLVVNTNGAEVRLGATSQHDNVADTRKVASIESWKEDMCGFRTRAARKIGVLLFYGRLYQAQSAGISWPRRFE